MADCDRHLREYLQHREDRSEGASLPIEKHKGLRLCPDNRISGDKIIGKCRLPNNNRATIALR